MCAWCSKTSEGCLPRLGGVEAGAAAATWVPAPDPRLRPCLRRKSIRHAPPGNARSARTTHRRDTECAREVLRRPRRGGGERGLRALGTPLRHLHSGPVTSPCPAQKGDAVTTAPPDVSVEVNFRWGVTILSPHSK